MPCFASETGKELRISTRALPVDFLENRNAQDDIEAVVFFVRTHSLFCAVAEDDVRVVEAAEQHIMIGKRMKKFHSCRDHIFVLES